MGFLGAIAIEVTWSKHLCKGTEFGVDAGASKQVEHCVSLEGKSGTEMTR